MTIVGMLIALLTALALASGAPAAAQVDTTSTPSATSTPTPAAVPATAPALPYTGPYLLVPFAVSTAPNSGTAGFGNAPASLDAAVVAMPEATTARPHASALAATGADDSTRKIGLALVGYGGLLVALSRVVPGSHRTD